MLQVVDCRAIHGVRLITHRGPSLDALRLDQGYQATILLEELHGLEPERADPDDFQFCVLSRIGIIPVRPSPLLDALPLYRSSAMPLGWISWRVGQGCRARRYSRQCQ